eukprot:NODE_1846_length_1586_cov_151.515379_g1758_i0.p1 GENE.NODE_1846_length_1586_cov_151.515379_g1758_i0~~NODE_1846_length_1586_cov_151.515379_g1758_i0.p1  ORF type:complete len:340 (-),score=33.46 NODE_1846_length_1586_cov_151.515379_g1758_i0:566-1522(-)
MLEHVTDIFLPSETSVPVIHPELKDLGRLWIPQEHIQQTKGLDRYLTGKPHSPSFCMLYQHGRCAMGKQCNQVHVNRIYGYSLRETIARSAVSTCCHHHGDLPSILGMTAFDNSRLKAIQLDCEGYDPIEVDFTQIAYTEYFANAIRSKKKIISFKPDRICNLHQYQACKYGVECRNVHMCRELYSSIFYPVEPTPYFPELEEDPYHMYGGYGEWDCQYPEYYTNHVSVFNNSETLHKPNLVPLATNISEAAASLTRSDATTADAMASAVESTPYSCEDLSRESSPPPSVTSDTAEEQDENAPQCHHPYAGIKMYKGY